MDKFEKKLVRKVNFSHALGVVAQTVIGLSAFVGIKQSAFCMALTTTLTLATPLILHKLWYEFERSEQKKIRHPDYKKNTRGLNEISYQNKKGASHTFQVSIFSDEVPQAAAGVGGQICATKGLFDLATEDEMFCVLSHEDFHVRHGHAWRSLALKANGMTVMGCHYLSAIYAASHLQTDQMFAHLGLGVLTPVIAEMVMRRFEYAADSAILLRTRDVESAVSYRLKTENKDIKSFFTSVKNTLFYPVIMTHPTNKARIKNLVKTAKKLGL